MSSLSRYKKSGGFVQLLSLIETFGPEKKKRFVEMIAAESSVWAEALREKMLSIDRILGWPDQAVIDVFKSMQPKNLVFALEGIPVDHKNRILSFFSAAERRRMADVLSESSPKPEDIAMTLAKVVETARRLVLERQLYVDKFDATLLIPEEFEAQLDSQHQMHNVTAKAAIAHFMSSSEAPTGLAASAEPNAEVIQLQNTLGAMAKENKWLKEEVRALREKLDQIKKLSA